MKQVLQIFVKDLRHYWREGAASIALLIAFAWKDVRGWKRYGNVGTTFGGIFSLRFLMGSIDVLLPVAWAFLIVRVIQGESLVGDRQFWLTRPYEWKKLLAAKLLFVVIFLNAPWLIVGMFLLARAGYSPAHYMVGLLWMQLSMAMVLILPATALAAVTRNVGQILLALLGIAAYGIGMAWLSDQIPSSSFSGPSDYLTGTLVIGGCVLILFLQYARRRTEASRIVIGAVAVGLLLILIATPYQAIVDHEFPPAEVREQLPFQMTLLPGENSQQEASPQDSKEVTIRLPMSVTGVSPDSIVVVDGFMVEIETPNSVSWNSGWISRGLSFFPDTKDARIDFSLKKKVFERMESSLVKARISLAFTLFHDVNQSKFIVPRGQFVMQDVGPCFAEDYSREIHCLTPLRGPRSLMITTDLSENTCPLLEGESPAPPGEIGRDWNRNSDSDPAEFGVSPVQSIDFMPLGLYKSGSRPNAGFCPGTPVVLSNPQVASRNQTAMEVDNLRLSDYRLAPLRFDHLVVSR